MDLFGEVDPEQEFEELVARMAAAAPPRTPYSPSDVAQWSFVDAALYSAHRVAQDPLLRAAVKRMFVDNWLVRRTAMALAETIL